MTYIIEFITLSIREILLRTFCASVAILLVMSLV